MSLSGISNNCKMDSRLGTLTYQAGLYIVADVLQRGLAFILIPLYTIFLTPADYGILSITTAFAGVLSIIYLQSFEAAFNRFYFDFKTEEEKSGFYGSAWIFLVLFLLISSLAIDRFGSTYNTLGFHSIGYKPYLRLALFTVLLTNATILLPRALFRVKEKVWQFAVLNLSLALVTSGLIIYFVAVKKEGALGSLKGGLLGVLLLAIPCGAIIFKNINWGIHFNHIKSALAFALPLIPHLLSLWALNLSDRFILERYVSLKDIGIYGLGYQLASILQIVAFSATNAISPFYYRTAANPQDAQNLLPRVATYYLFFLAWGATALIGFSSDILLLIAADKAFHSAYRVIPWVVFGFFARGFYFVFVMAVYYSKNLKLLSVITMIALGINVILNFIFIPRYGYVAAACTTFIAFALQAAIMYFYAQKCFPLKYETRRLFHMTVGLVAISFILWNLSSYATLAAFLLKAILVAGFPLFLLATGFFNRDELTALKKSRQLFQTSFGGYYARAKKIFKIG